MTTCLSDRSDVYIFDVLSEDSLRQAVELFFDMCGGNPSVPFLTQEVTPMKTLLVSFVFGDSKRNGIIMGIRHELPNKVKDAKDFPGTFYKVMTDDHDQKKIYRYVPLHLVAQFLEDTQTGSKILEKVLTNEELSEVNQPVAGEVWEDNKGTRYLVLENGFFATSQGLIIDPDEIESNIECVGQGIIELDSD